jgi:hypothetical protein
MPGLRKSAAKFGYMIAMQNVKKEIKKDGDLTMSELKDISYKGKKKGNKRKELSIEKTSEHRIKPIKKKPKKKILSIEKTSEHRIKPKPKKPKKPTGLSISKPKNIKITLPKKPKSKRKKKSKTEIDKKKLLKRTHRLDYRRKRKHQKKPLTGMTMAETRLLDRFTLGDD